MKVMDDTVFLRRKKSIRCKTCKEKGQLIGIKSFSGEKGRERCPVCEGTGRIAGEIVFIETLVIQELDLSSSTPRINQEYHWGVDIFPTPEEAKAGKLTQSNEPFPKLGVEPGKDFPRKVFYACRNGKRPTCTCCRGKGSVALGHECPFCYGHGKLFVWGENYKIVEHNPYRFSRHCDGSPMVDGSVLNKYKFFSTMEGAIKHWKKCNP
jgi:RecJ-like exonuclease